MIPGDVTEAALDQCEKTMRAKADTSPAGIKQMLDAFAEFNVTAPMIEARIQRRVDAIQPAQVVALEKIYNSLRDGISEVADWFQSVPLEEKPAADPSEPRRETRGRRGHQRTRQPEKPADEPQKPADEPRNQPQQSGTLPNFEV